jgi:hypothetical protein
MARPDTSLGDSHNFGRRVVLRGGRVRKPRTVFWEWLVLSDESPLRRLLAAKAARDALGPGAFAFLPTLRFFGPSARDAGEVERVTLEPLGKLGGEDRRDLAAAAGRGLALFSWLGVSDLHWENLMLGRGRDGSIVFAPLDIESVLSDLSLPTETKLLPDPDPEYAAVCRHACGVRRLLPFLGKPVEAASLGTMVGAYFSMLTFLDRNATAVAKVLSAERGLRTAPIRVCLRGTDEYVRSRSVPPWPPLLDAEAEQLERGDIPYFFRLYGQPGIRYYADPTLKKIRSLPTRGDVPKLEPLLSVSKGLRSPSRTRLAEEGLFTLLGAFDHPGLTGRLDAGAVEVRFGARSIVVRLPDAKELRSPRKLGALVSSVYLPCRCGEVRGVLVPRVTRCALTW